MKPITPHLSYSGITEYLKDRQSFFKKYIRYEFDKNTWLGTVIGNGVHYAIEQFLRNDSGTIATHASEYVLKQIEKYQRKELVLNDKDITDITIFEQELRSGLQRCVPVVTAYINSKMLFAPEAVEMTYKLKLPKGNLPLKAKIDYIGKDGSVIDWKVVKEFTKGESIERMLQAVAYALVREAKTGVRPSKVTFVEILRTPSDQEKLDKYKAEVADIERRRADGEKGLRKPPAPKPKENELRIQEVVTTIDQWKVDVFLELYDRICRELSGENLYAKMQFLPAIEAKYGDPAGWEDFVVEVVGYNPYTVTEDGEIVDEVINTEALPTNNGEKTAVDAVYDEKLMMKAKDKEYGNEIEIPVSEEYIAQKEAAYKAKLRDMPLTGKATATDVAENLNSIGDVIEKAKSHDGLVKIPEHIREDWREEAQKEKAETAVQKAEEIIKDLEDTITLEDLPW